MNSRQRTYTIWSAMKNRCDSPTAKDYPNYGGRGITYDPSWKSFAASATAELSAA